jgi:hypothetical protein
MQTSIRPIIYIVVACCISFLVSMPRLFYCASAGELFAIGAWEAMYKKADDLTATLKEYPPESNAAKRVFRLTIPVFLKLTGKPSPAVVYGFQLLLGIAVIYLFYLLCLSLIPKRESLLLSLYLPFLYFGRSAWVDIYSWFDTFAFFFILSGMFSRNYLLKILFFFAAFWTDERALLAFPAVILWEIRNEIFNRNLLLVIWNRKTLFLTIPVFFYAGIRLFLEANFGMGTPHADVSLSTISKTISTFNIAEISFYEGFWLIIVLGIWRLIALKQVIPLFLLLLVFLSQTLVAHMVYDTTRSGSYWFPLVLFFLHILSKWPDALNNLKFITYGVGIGTFMVPGFYVLGGIKYLTGVHEEFLLWFFGRL